MYIWIYLILSWPISKIFYISQENKSTGDGRNQAKTHLRTYPKTKTQPLILDNFLFSSSLNRSSTHTTVPKFDFLLQILLPTRSKNFTISCIIPKARAGRMKTSSSLLHDDTIHWNSQHQTLLHNCLIKRIYALCIDISTTWTGI